MALAYTAPTWTDGSGEGISASNLQAISNCVEGLVQGTDKAVHSISINGSVITLTFADGTQETASISNLKGIVSITKTGTAGNVDTYTILYTDGTTDTFTVTNGQSGSSSLAELTDVELTTPAANQVLKYYGTKWINANLPSIPDGLADLTDDVNISSPTEGQVLQYDSATGKWINGAAPATNDTWVTGSQTVSSGAFTFSGLDDTQGWAYEPYFVVTGSSTNLNPAAEISTISGAGTSSMSVSYTTDADEGATVKLRIIK